MPVVVEFDGRIIEVKLVGRLVGSELQAQLGEITAIEQREAFTPGRVIDFRELDTADIRFNDVFGVAEKRRQEKLKNAIKSAFLVKTNVQYGIARTFQTINDNPQITIRIFRDEAEARAWLAEEPGDYQTP